jgi:3',5'-cyclic AMP phosphodiesterase CpdA
VLKILLPIEDPPLEEKTKTLLGILLRGKVREMKETTSWMKIAHLSDLHICQKSRPKNLERARLLIDYALQQSVDHFVITGDIIHLNEGEDLVAFRNLLDEFDLLDSSRVTMVIGNHDIFGGVYLAEDILAYPKKCESVDFDKKIVEFKNYFFETFENTYFTSSQAIYPYAKIVGDVVFIGINSCSPYSKFRNLFAAKGKVGTRQVENIRQILSKTEFQNKIKIVLIHHHFKKINHHSSLFRNSFLQNLESFGDKLRKKKRLIKLFRRHKVDLILHGHDHHCNEYWIKNLHFMNAAGCIDKNVPGELQINFITITRNKIETEIQRISENCILEQKECRNSKLVLAI